MINYPIPATGNIRILAPKEHWRMVEDGRTHILPTYGFVETQGKEVRINLLFFHVSSPESQSSQSKTLSETSYFNEQIERGFNRILDFLMTKILDRKMWTIIGFVDVPAQENLILIHHYEGLEETIYTTDFDVNSYEDILPPGVFPPK